MLPLVIVTVSHRPVSPDACVTCLTVMAACLVLQVVIVTVSHRPVSPDACVTCLIMMGGVFDVAGGDRHGQDPGLCHLPDSDGGVFLCCRW